MYQWSRELQDKIIHRYPQDPKLRHLISCTQLAKEVLEVLDCVNWKFERDDPKLNKSREELIEELVDVFNFWMKLMHTHKVSLEEFSRAWEKKKLIIEERLL
jgi:NTP pyrophosphatase (non-canonical NTP hydrolase)